MGGDRGASAAEVSAAEVKDAGGRPVAIDQETEGERGEPTAYEIAALRRRVRVIARLTAAFFPGAALLVFTITCFVATPFGYESFLAGLLAGVFGLAFLLIADQLIPIVVPMEIGSNCPNCGYARVGDQRFARCPECGVLLRRGAGARGTRADGEAKKSG